MLFAAACLPTSTLPPSGSLACCWAHAGKRDLLFPGTPASSHRQVGPLPWGLPTAWCLTSLTLPFKHLLLKSFSSSPCRPYAALFFFTNSAQTIYLSVNVFLHFSHQNVPRSQRAGCVYSSPSPSARSPEALRTTQGSSWGGKCPKKRSVFQRWLDFILLGRMCLLY